MGFKHKAKRYDRTIRVFKPAASPTVNDDGGVVDDGDEWLKRRAAIKATGGSEGDVGGQQVGDVTHLVRTPADRRTRQITNQHWLILEDGITRLDVVKAYIPDDTGGTEVEMQCNERISGGV